MRKQPSAPHFSMTIRWSSSDQAFFVSFPEWQDYILQPVTHGETYEDAARCGRAVLENLIA